MSLGAAGALAIGCASDPRETPRANCSGSSLYGIQGEGWNPSGRLLDYGYAGYHTGSEAIPTVTTPAVSVTDYGARPDDEVEVLALPIAGFTALADARPHLARVLIRLGAEAASRLRHANAARVEALDRALEEERTRVTMGRFVLTLIVAYSI